VINPGLTEPNSAKLEILKLSVSAQYAATSVQFNLKDRTQPDACPSPTTICGFMQTDTTLQRQCYMMCDSLYCWRTCS